MSIRTLPGVGALVDDRLQLTAALEHRSGPRVQHCDIQACKPHVREMSLVDVDDLEAAAMSLVRQRLELARARVAAVAARELIALDVPVDITHDTERRIQPSLRLGL
ncbi:MAG TPA: hypothetical protein VH542_00330 [Steroidobacteraceae bacterium]|jgi:hypothetical protein